MQRQINYELTYTADDETWRTEYFECCTAMRTRARELKAENEENEKFSFYARKFETLLTCDVLDTSMPFDKMRLALYDCIC